MLSFIMVSCLKRQGMEVKEPVKTIDLSAYPSSKPDKPVNLIFIHHSCGGQLLADKGKVVSENAICSSHPNGGGLRRLLEDNNYIVHEASYGSKIGEDTDICHWNKKFRDSMEIILACKGQDKIFSNGTKNKIVIFKSCFPNSWIQAEGREPGDPDSCEQTIYNYKASYRALLSYFESNPDTLFVAVTAPALAQPSKVKEFIKKIMGKGRENVDEVGTRARAFNNWLKDSKDGWLMGYRLKNVVVFDYYDILTGNGQSDWSMYPSGNGKDSHPSSLGNTKTAKEFVPFLNKAMHRFEP
jgi:hypothetical protein